MRTYSIYYSSYYFTLSLLLLLLYFIITLLSILIIILIITLLSITISIFNSFNYLNNYQLTNYDNNLLSILTLIIISTTRKDIIYLVRYLIYYRTISRESLDRVDKRLDKISVALCDLRSRYMTLNLVARTLLIFITIIISSDYNK